jgi:hypothetical protein
MHGQVPLLWVRAAQWEHRHNQDMDAARHMLQRGIRINPASPGNSHSILSPHMLIIDS